MTLERLNERINESADKVGRIDGRCFNVRSKRKMSWEIVNIKRLGKVKKKRSSCGLVRGVFTAEEMREYEEINKKEREERNKEKMDEIKEAEEVKGDEEKSCN